LNIQVFATPYPQESLIIFIKKSQVQGHARAMTLFFKKNSIEMQNKNLRNKIK
jgi:hypothetical protein